MYPRAGAQPHGHLVQLRVDLLHILKVAHKLCSKQAVIPGCTIQRKHAYLRNQGAVGQRKQLRVLRQWGEQRRLGRESVQRCSRSCQLLQMPARRSVGTAWPWLLQVCQAWGRKHAAGACDWPPLLRRTNRGILLYRQHVVLAHEASTTKLSTAPHELVARWGAL